MRTDHIHLVFLIDCSGSMDGGEWRSAMEGYRTFLEEQKYSPGAMVTVDGYSFGDDLNQHFTNVDIHKAPEKLAFYNGGTAIGLSLYALVTQYLIPGYRKPGYKKSTSETPGLLCVVLITDGGDGFYAASATQQNNMNQAIKDFQDENTFIFTFSPGALQYDGYGINPKTRFRLSSSMEKTVREASKKILRLRSGESI